VPNVPLLGPSGVGKSHLNKVGLAIRAINRGYVAHFVRAHELLEDLARAQEEHRLDCRLRVYLALKVLISNEFGVWPYDRLAATVLFTLVSARYGRGSITLTQIRASPNGARSWAIQ
jgi:DNA replication protein DnaC